MLTELRTAHASAQDYVAVFENEHGHTFYVEHDLDAQDPRVCGDFMPPCYILPGYRTSDPLAGAEDSHPLITLFLAAQYDYTEAIADVLDEDEDSRTVQLWTRVFETVPERDLTALAETVTDLYRTANPGDPDTLHVFREVGYSQGDVWDILVVETPDLPHPEMAARTLGGWIRGDVYACSCDCGEAICGLDGFDLDYDKVAEHFAGEYCAFDPEADPDEDDATVTLSVTFRAENWAGMPEEARRETLARIVQAIERDRTVESAVAHLID